MIGDFAEVAVSPPRVSQTVNNQSVGGEDVPGVSEVRGDTGSNSTPKELNIFELGHLRE